jgi:hypothetical protein
MRGAVPPISQCAFMAWGSVKAQGLCFAFFLPTGWTVGVHGFDSRLGLGIFLITTASTQPPNQWIPWAFSLRVKRPGREADHSPPSSARVKIGWSYTSHPPMRLLGAVLSQKHRDGL